MAVRCGKRGYPRRMSAPGLTHLLLAAEPGAPGVAALLARAAAEGASGGLRILLSGAGLAWAADEARAELPVGAAVSVCSRNAGDAGWRAATTPAGIGWSSVGTWLAEVDDADAYLWTALP